MLVPILIGGTALGLWLLVRGKSSTKPPIPLPPGPVDPVSMSDARTRSPYSVVTTILREGEDSFVNQVEFDNWDAARGFYKQNVAFFDENNSSWTCPNGQMSLMLLTSKSGTTSSVKLAKTYECQR